jgi:hypothetical protein
MPMPTCSYRNKAWASVKFGCWLQLLLLIMIANCQLLVRGNLPTASIQHEHEVRFRFRMQQHAAGVCALALSVVCALL